MTYAQFIQIANAKSRYIAEVNKQYLNARMHGQRDPVKPRPVDIFEHLVLERIAEVNFKTKLHDSIKLPAFISKEQFNHLLSVIKT